MRTPTPLVAGLTILLVVAACGGGGSPSASSATQPSPSPAVSPSTSPSASSEATDTPEPSSPSTATVATAASSHGTILVDADGFTLYGFTRDTDGMPTCYDACATAWPPAVVAGDIVVGDDLDDGTFSLVARTDGAQQLKAGDWPLYRFSGDAAPGDTNGQGLNGVWFVIDPEGELIR